MSHPPPRSRRLTLAVIGVATFTGGALTGLVWPRGPLTTLAAGALLSLCLAGGLLAGWRGANRWSTLVMPLAFLAGYELTGGGAGPTVGDIDVTTSWGIIGAVAGRALLACVALLPLAVGAALGAGRARAALNAPATARTSRRWLRTHLRKRKDTAALATLESFGDPPYASVGAYAWIAGYYDALAGDYDPPKSYVERGEAAGVGPLGLLAPEYRFVDRFGAARGLMDTFSVLYPQWQQIDFRRDVPQLDVPVHIFTGAHELAGRRAVAEEWFTALRAPRKALHDFENAGHAAAFEHVEALHTALKGELRRERRAAAPG